jgi:hypothetical protein
MHAASSAILIVTFVFALLAIMRRMWSMLSDDGDHHRRNWRIRHSRGPLSPGAGV